MQRGGATSELSMTLSEGSPSDGSIVGTGLVKKPLGSHSGYPCAEMIDDHGTLRDECMCAFTNQDEHGCVHR